MQLMKVKTTKKAIRGKIKKLEAELQDYFKGAQNGEMVECPFCHYMTEKTKRFSCKVFVDGDSKSMKCFACGKWRRIN